MQVPSMSLLRAYSPFFGARSSATCSANQALQHQHATFSSTSKTCRSQGVNIVSKKMRKNDPDQRDPKMKMIRYFFRHPVRPPLLRFSRLRYLRHWTINRAWQLHKSKLREKRTTERYQQYQSMANACEVLRNIDTLGFTAEERAAHGLGEAPADSMGKLFRVAMDKTGIWNSVPIEYGRIQTDTPPKNGWNHEWTR